MSNLKKLTQQINARPKFQTQSSFNSKINRTVTKNFFRSYFGRKLLFWDHMHLTNEIMLISILRQGLRGRIK